MSAEACVALRTRYDVRYVGPINPEPILRQKVLSNIGRITGRGGHFFFFSRERLNEIAREVRDRCASDAEFDFFHGFTPWALTRPERPYAAWSDCTFSDYIDIFHDRARFTPADLRRIERAEGEWLRRARLLLFTSEWARQRAIHQHGLDAGRTRCVGVFGELDLPERDEYAGEKTFVFISTDFYGKGGSEALEAFRSVRAHRPEVSLFVIGDRPVPTASESDIKFLGFLRKEVGEERRRYLDILTRARAVLHPTRKDIAPLLLVEAAYVGCPVISSRRFAIPELVEPGVTGLLPSEAPDPSDIAEAMNWMLECENDYRRMRKAAWLRARRQHTKARFRARLLESLASHMSESAGQCAGDPRESEDGDVGAEG